MYTRNLNVKKANAYALLTNYVIIDLIGFLFVSKKMNFVF